MIAYYNPEFGQNARMASKLLLLPLISAGVRRLRDGGHSPWWQVIMLIPILGWLFLFILYADKTDTESDQTKPEST